MSKERDFLLDIKNIIEGKGTDKVLFEDINFIANIDSILRNYYSKLYNESLYKLSDDKKIGNVDGIDIYDAGIEFNLCVYSFGMATDYDTPENFNISWNRPKISTYYMCNSIITDSSINTNVKHCLFGFNSFGDNNLSLLGSNDLGTGRIYDQLNVTNPFHQSKLIADVEFRTPDSLIRNTRFTNNEVYRSRRRVVNGKLERINPNYIVYLKTMEDFSKDKIWLESLKAAKDFNIPIVIVDCKRCILNNVDKIEQEVELFESRFDDSKILSKIIESIYAINCGFRNIAPQLVEECFSYERIMSYVWRIISHIDEISITSPRTAIECIDIVLNALDNEFDKIMKSPVWVEKSREDGYIIDKPRDVIKVFEDKKRDLELVLGSSNNNRKL